MEQHERSAFSSPIAGKAVRAAFDGGRLTSDAGVLLLAEIERRLGIAERLLSIACRNAAARVGTGQKDRRQLSSCLPARPSDPLSAGVPAEGLGTPVFAVRGRSARACLAVR